MNKTEALEKLAALEKETAELRQIIEAPEKPVKTKEQRFFELIDGCSIKIDKEKHPDSIFFLKGDKYFFEIEKDVFWCSWMNVWSIFGEEYSLNYEQTRAFIRSQIEEHFKCKGLTPDLKC